jgi:hypothetical protein
MKRDCQAAIITAILLLFVSLAIPAIAAAGMSGAVPPAIELPVNDTPIFSTGGPGNRAPAIHHEPEPLITLLRLDWNATDFPGPRSMAFGPRYIEFSANSRALLILAAGAGIAVLAFVVYRRRKIGAVTAETVKEAPENGDEKQD